LQPLRRRLFTRTDAKRAISRHARESVTADRELLQT
jgi:hypothetical protein